MSTIASNFQQICNSPTNNSKSKMLFSFSKAPRFHIQKKTSCQKFYNTEYHSSKRSTNFGYGNKYDFTKEAPISPPPNKYDIASEFTPVKNKGFGFGSSRNQMQVTGPLVDTIKNKNPGPGSYHIPPVLERTSYSMGKKYSKDDLWKKSIPGPGQYESINTLNEKGKYFLSKHKNSGVHSISLLRHKDTNLMNSPGPGKYEPHDSLSPEGKYLNSRHFNSCSRHFSKEKRKGLEQNLNSPGPGCYRLPSEFGYYESKKSAVQWKENKEN